MTHSNQEKLVKRTKNLVLNNFHEELVSIIEDKKFDLICIFTNSKLRLLEARQSSYSINLTFDSTKITYNSRDNENLEYYLDSSSDMERLIEKLKNNLYGTGPNPTKI